MRQFIFFALVVITFVVVALFRLKSTSEHYKIAGFTQGTTYHITYENEGYGDLTAQVDSILELFDLSLSTYVEESVISKVNVNDPTVVIDDKFKTVFKEARRVFEETDGYFDITVGPVVNALGFGPEGQVEFDSLTIDSLLQFVGMDMVEIHNGKVIKEKDGIKLDVNAIAQGYSVDVIAEYLEDLGIRNYLVEIGGEIKARGKNQNREIWRIGLDNPEENNNAPGADLYTRLYLKNRSLATSGNYRRFFEKDGVKYTHSINPKTGYPVSQNLLSATIFSEDCITADAFATACMVMGLEKAKLLVQENNEISGYFIYSDDSGKYQVWYSDELENDIID
jgi:thiamine biosynthesis lipoprotein